MCGSLVVDPTTREVRAGGVAARPAALFHCRGPGRGVAAAVEEQAATTAEMARNIAEAAGGSREIADGISTVSGAVDGTRQSVATAQRAADDLNATAQRLTGLVGRFTA